MISGIALCLIISLPSYFLGSLLPVVGGPVFAILFGMIISLFYKDKSKTQKGISFTSKKILQYAVILLGFSMNISSILQQGAKSLPIIVVTISTSLILAFVFYKILKIDSQIATLVGIGSSICGGSAIAASSSVINADEEKIATSISVIFLFNVIAALIFPTLGELLNFSNEGFALFCGTAVNDTSSVTSCASTWDLLHENALCLENATIVKLTRTLAIIPITLVLSFLQAKKSRSQDNKFSLKKVFPFFILWFLVASLITTFVPIPEVLLKLLKFLSKFFIIMAMGAIGLNTNIIKLVKTGGKPILLGFICWVGIIGVSLLMQNILNMW